MASDHATPHANQPENALRAAPNQADGRTRKQGNDLRFQILLAVLLTLFVGTVGLMMLAATLSFDRANQPFDKPSDYPQLFTTFTTLHGHFARHLPPSIPPGARDVRLNADLNDMLQAEPFLFLAFQLDAADAEAELARLRAAHPQVEESSPSAPYRFDLEIQTPCHEAITLDFVGTPAHWVGRHPPGASVWHDPTSGWFCYELSGG